MEVYIVYEYIEWEDGSTSRPEAKCICLDKEQAEIEKLNYELEFGDMREMHEDDGEELDYICTYEIEKRTFKEQFDNTITL